MTQLNYLKKMLRTTTKKWGSMWINMLWINNSKKKRPFLRRNRSKRNRVVLRREVVHFQTRILHYRLITSSTCTEWFDLLYLYLLLCTGKKILPSKLNSFKTGWKRFLTPFLSTLVSKIDTSRQVLVMTMTHAPKHLLKLSRGFSATSLFRTL